MRRPTGRGHPRGRPGGGRPRVPRRHPAAGHGASAPAARAAICWAKSVVWIPWKSPSSQPTSWACAMRSSASLGVASSVKGRESRSSSSTSSGARPSSSSFTELAWISLRRLRLASSRGAARTSSSSCLIMLPIRMTFAGCSTCSVTGVSRESSSPSLPPPSAIPSWPTTRICGFSGDRSFLGISIRPLSRTPASQRGAPPEAAAFPARTPLRRGRCGGSSVRLCPACRSRPPVRGWWASIRPNLPTVRPCTGRRGRSRP